MKFGKQLQLGIYEPWKAYYIQYGKLKRIIRRLRFIADREEEKRKKQFEKRITSNGSFASISGTSNTIPSHLSGSNIQMSNLESGNTTESTPLNPKKRTLNANNNAYLSSNLSLNSLSDGQSGNEGNNGYSNGNVYNNTNTNVDENLDFFALIVEEMNKVNNFYIGKLAELRISLEEIFSERKNSYRSHHTSADASYLLRLRDIYVDLAALRSFCELNKTGFYKIIKKYDKIMQENTLESWLKTIERQSFAHAAEPVTLMDTVTSLVSRDKLIEWERFATEQQLNSSQNSLNDIFPSVRFPNLFFALFVFFILLLPTSPISYVIPSHDFAATRCFALLIFTVLLWVTEAIPYFATALLVPIMVVLMQVLKENPTNGGSATGNSGSPLGYKLMSNEAAAQFVIDHMFNHTTVLLLGGYTISTAFSRCQLELRIASYLQHTLGEHPTLFILAVMFLGLFLSMWISNHTAPILCAAIILPIVRDLPTESQFSKSLLLGLAYACNIGGMMTPISSLQNVLAVSYLEQMKRTVSFGSWLLISVPFCIVSTLIAWFLLTVLMPPSDLKSIPVIVFDSKTNIFTRRNVTVMVLSLITLLFFALFTFIKPIFGDIAMVSLCFVVAMFGSGMLSEVDFNSLSWHTLFLVGGGNVLGKAVASSGLLGYLSDMITYMLPLQQPWWAFFLILVFCCVVATFVSHTVASLILMPIIASIGKTLDMPEAVVLGAAFAVSGAMALPFSSFPNVNSLLIVDDFQQPYLNVSDFLKTGLLITLVVTLLIATDRKSVV